MLYVLFYNLIKLITQVDDKFPDDVMTRVNVIAMTKSLLQVPFCFGLRLKCIYLFYNTLTNRSKF